MKPLVSVIVPVFNGEKHIRKCLESIMKQSFSEIEIVVVNDGSIDKTEEVLTELSLKDKRIKVINQVNSGVAEARNNGIRNSLGEYIGFVDADDYIDETMYEKMYKKAVDNSCDIVICNVNDVKNGEQKVSLSLNEGIINMDIIMKEDFICETYCKLGTAVWHKIFKADLIKNNKITFINYNEVASEDTLFNFETMMKANKIYCLNEPLYDYMITESSLTKSKLAKSNMVKRCVNSVNLIKKCLNENSIKADNYLNYLTYWEFINALSYVEEIKINNIRNAIKEYSKIDGFKKSIKKIAFSNKLDKYFINHKGSYSTINKVFDKVFSLLCFANLYYLAAIIHSIRLKRARTIQNI